MIAACFISCACVPDLLACCARVWCVYVVRVEYPTSLLRHPVTLVTSYWLSLNAKHSATEYAKWIDSFYPYSRQPMLVATSPALFPRLAAIRYSRCGDVQMQAETAEVREKRFTKERVRDIERQVQTQTGAHGGNRPSRHHAHDANTRQCRRLWTTVCVR